MLHKLKNLLLYAGLEKAEYDALSERIAYENLYFLAIYSFLAVCVLLILDVASLLTTSFAAANRGHFLLLTLIMLGIIFVGYFGVYKSGRNYHLVTPLVYAFLLSLYSYAISLSALHPERSSVTSIVFLVMEPLLFYGRPIFLIGLTTAATALICVFSTLFKTPEAAAYDRWNAVSFALVAFGMTLLMMRVKVKALAQDLKIQYLSETDVLTGLKNRNCFENKKMEYPHLCRETVVCVYADVNGLHELNNTQGHGAGDRMLQTVAREMQKQFGKEHTFRIGGDEFVAFAPDVTLEAVQKNMDEIQSRLNRYQYHISFGLSSARSKQADMDSVVKQAEEEMFLSKRAWYQQTGHNRRQRRS